VDLVLTEAVFTPERLQRMSYEVLFEDIGFRSVYVGSAAHFALQHTLNASQHTLTLLHSPCHLVVDSGYSFTHILPFFDRHLLNYAVKRYSFLKWVLY
jgi:actin-related protein 6